MPKSKIETYDAQGKLSETGLYDIGGNIIPERYAEYIEYQQDCYGTR